MRKVKKNSGKALAIVNFVQISQFCFVLFMVHKR